MNMPEEPNNQPLIRVRNLHKSYGDRQILNGIDFDVPRGECLVILGRSGSGKSVTLRQLNGLEKPDQGSIQFDGEEITTLSEKELYPMRRRLSMLFQGGALFDSMTVFENLAFPIREHGIMEGDELKEQVATLLARVGMEKIEDRYPSALSGGMKKRVALARSMALEPEGILFDEPTTGLDPMTSDSIAHLIGTTQRARGLTSVVVTHDIPLARTVGDRIAFIDGGVFRFIGTWAEAEGGGDALLSRFLAGQRQEDDIQ